MVSINVINKTFILSCLIALGLSLYSYVIELAIEQDENYVATCDISEHISCTKAFKSEYGKGFGIVGKLLGKDSFLNKPNSLAGIIFYSFLATLGHSNSYLINTIALIATAASNLLSMYFAYILIFILKDFCIVCVSIYAINFINFMLLYFKLSKINELEEIKYKTN